MTRTTLPGTLPGSARRVGLALAALAFTAGGLTACGGGDDASSASKDASKDDFCGAFGKYISKIQDASTGGTGTDTKIGSTIKEYASDLSDTGTPSDISASARRGFELVVKASKDVPDDATVEDLTKMDTKYSDAEQKDALAFATYVQKTCPDLLSGLTGGAASPSASPSS